MPVKDKIDPANAQGYRGQTELTTIILASGEFLADSAGRLGGRNENGLSPSVPYFLPISHGSCLLPDTAGW
jgi:hypothetical protein